MSPREFEALGSPQLKIAGLQVWVHARQFPNAQDYWDGNWLRVTAYSSYPNSNVQARGPIVHLGEVYGLSETLKRLYKSLSGQAALKCIEPNLDVLLEAGSTGHIEVLPNYEPDA